MHSARCSPSSHACRRPTDGQPVRSRASRPADSVGRAVLTGSVRSIRRAVEVEGLRRVVWLPASVHAHGPPRRRRVRHRDVGRALAGLGRTGRHMARQGDGGVGTCARRRVRLVGGLRSGGAGVPVGPGQSGRVAVCATRPLRGATRADEDVGSPARAPDRAAGTGRVRSTDAPGPAPTGRPPDGRPRACGVVRATRPRVRQRSLRRLATRHDSGRRHGRGVGARGERRGARGHRQSVGAALSATRIDRRGVRPQARPAAPTAARRGEPAGARPVHGGGAEPALGCPARPGREVRLGVPADHGLR